MYESNHVYTQMYMCVCVCVCACVCARACVRACVCVHANKKMLVPILFIECRCYPTVAMS